MSEDKLYYNRAPLPENNEWGGNLVATRFAIHDLLTHLDAEGVDPARGEFRIYYPVDSALIRTYVTAEWRPNK